MYLPDINVWLALTFITHIHHQSAQSWFDSLAGDRRCYFCRFTQHGFLRLANNPKVFAQAAVPQDLAWKLYDTIVSDPRIEVASEPVLLEPIWRQFTASRGCRQTPGAMLTWPPSPSPEAMKP
jgi:toxin-antitoxin system PIN domain toxin